MKEGLPGGKLRLSPRTSQRRPKHMLHAGLDLGRKRLDVCLLSEHGELVEEFSAPPDADGLRGLVRHVGRHGVPVRGVIESMIGARFVHDTLERLGWEVLIADAQKVKGLAPLACKTDKIDARVLAVLSERDLVPAIWLPDPRIRSEREQARFRLHLVSAAPGSPRSTSPESSPRQSGTCSPTTSPSRPLLPREAPLFVGPPDGPFGIAPPRPASNVA